MKSTGAIGGAFDGSAIQLFCRPPKFPKARLSVCAVESLEKGRVSDTMTRLFGQPDCYVGRCFERRMRLMKGHSCEVGMVACAGLGARHSNCLSRRKSGWRRRFEADTIFSNHGGVQKKDRRGQVSSKWRSISRGEKSL